MGGHLPWNILLARGVAFFIFGVGAFVCAMNFYLSFLRRPWFRLRGREAEWRYVSGAPLFGSILVVLYLIRPEVLGLPAWARIAGFVLAALDTGGIHWFIGVMIWMWIKGRNKKLPG